MNFYRYTIKAATNGYIVSRSYKIPKNMKIDYERYESEDLIFNTWEDLVKFIAENKVTPEVVDDIVNLSE